MSVTNDLKDFGQRELAEAGKLLSALNTSNDKTEMLGSGVVVSFNTYSGLVFLTDEDYNTAMINPETGHLEDWYYCPECGHEGFKNEMTEDGEDCCKEYMREAA